MNIFSPPNMHRLGFFLFDRPSPQEKEIRSAEAIAQKKEKNMTKYNNNIPCNSTTQEPTIVNTTITYMKEEIRQYTTIY